MKKFYIAKNTLTGKFFNGKVGDFFSAKRLQDAFILNGSQAALISGMFENVELLESSLLV